MALASRSRAFWPARALSRIGSTGPPSGQVRPGLQHRLYDGEELVRGERLVDVHHGSGLEAFGQRLAAALRGEEDDRDVLQAGVLLDLAADREAVHVGHHHVEKDEVEGASGEQLQRFRASRCGGDVETLLLQDGALEVEDILVVVDYEYTFRHLGAGEEFTILVHRPRARGDSSRGARPCQPGTGRRGWTPSPTGRTTARPE